MIKRLSHIFNAKVEYLVCLIVCSGNRRELFYRVLGPHSKVLVSFNLSLSMGSEREREKE